MRKVKVGVVLAVLAALFYVFSYESEEEKAMKEKARIEGEIKILEDSLKIAIYARNSAFDSLGVSTGNFYPECEVSSLKLRLDSAKKGLLENPFHLHCEKPPLMPYIIEIRDSVNDYYRTNYTDSYRFRIDSLKRILIINGFTYYSEEDKANKEKARIETEIKNAKDSISFYINARNSAWANLGATISNFYPECGMSSLKLRLDSATKGLLKNPFLPHCEKPSLPPRIVYIRDSVNVYYNVYLDPFMFRLDSLKLTMKEFNHDN